MRLLFKAQGELKRTLGGPKVVIELAENIAYLGHKVTVLGPKEVEKFF